MSAVTCCEKFGNVIGMNCCITEQDFKQRPLAELVQNENRQCTDVPCLLLLISVFISEFILIIYSVTKGANPELLWRGVDYNGNICNSANSDGSYVAWPDLSQSYSVKICVESCAETLTTHYLTNNSQMNVAYVSEQYLSAWCLPKYPSNFTKYSFTSSQKTYQRAVADLEITKYLILIMSLLAIVFAFMYLKMVACVGKILIWITILFVFVGGVTLIWLLMEKGITDVNSADSVTTGKIEIVIAVILMIVLFAILLALIWMRRSITLAINMLDEASHAIQDIKTTLIFPVIYSFVGLAFFTFWIIIAVYIYSVKVTEILTLPSIFSYLNVETYTKYSFSESMQNVMIYHIIVLYYIIHVIIYFGFMVIAGTIADWYFSDWDILRKKKIRGEQLAQLSNSPLLESFVRVLRFHLGTLAFGALVITIIRVIRCIVIYIESKSKGVNNPIVRCIFGCVNCCLRCCQCIFDRIAKEGFIFTTIYGSAFCFSSFQALKLLLANVTRTIMIESVSKLTEIFGRFAIAAFNTGLACLVLYYLDYYQENVSSFVFPVLVIFVISYTVGALFMMVLEVAVDTIFLCFLVDETVHHVPRFASAKLSKMVQLIVDDKSAGLVNQSGSAHEIVDDV